MVHYMVQVHGTLYGTSTWYTIWYKYMVHYIWYKYMVHYMVQVHGTLYGTSTWYMVHYIASLSRS